MEETCSSSNEEITEGNSKTALSIFESDDSHSEDDSAHFRKNITKNGHSKMEKKVKVINTLDDLFLIESDSDASIVYEPTIKDEPTDEHSGIGAFSDSETNEDDPMDMDKSTENNEDKLSDSSQNNIKITIKQENQTDDEFPVITSKDSIKNKIYSSVFEKYHPPSHERKRARIFNRGNSGFSKPYRKKRKLLIRKATDSKKFFNHPNILATNKPSEVENQTLNPPHSRDGMVFEIGARLEAQDTFGKWYPSKIIEIQGREILIHFERWSHRFDEWVSIDSPRLRAIQSSTPSRKVNKKSRFYEDILYFAGEDVLAISTDNRLHPGKIVDLSIPGYISVHYDNGYTRQVPETEVVKMPPEYKEKLHQSQGALDSQGRVAFDKLDSNNLPPVDIAGFTPEGRRIARKEFIISEDHNQFKCTVEGCTKSFRKESLLNSHLKHYHGEDIDTMSPGTLGKRSYKRMMLSSIRKRGTTGNKRPKPIIRIKPLPSPPPVMSASTSSLPTSLPSPTSQSQSLVESNPVLPDLPASQASPLPIKQETIVPDEIPALFQSDEDAGQVPSLTEPPKSLPLDECKQEVLSPSSPPSTSFEPPSQAEADWPSLKQPSQKSPIFPSLNSQPIKEDILDFPTSPLLVSSQGKKIGIDPSEALLSPQSLTTKSNSIGDIDNLTSPTSIVSSGWLGAGEASNDSMAIAATLDESTEGADEAIRCICKSSEETGLMIQCEECLTWQHGSCFNIHEESMVPEKYICYHCLVSDEEGEAETGELGWYHGDLPQFSHIKIKKKTNRKYILPTPAEVVYINNLVGAAADILEVLASLRHKINVLRFGGDFHPDLRHWMPPSRRENGPLGPTITAANHPAPDQPPIISSGDHSYSFAQNDASSPAAATLTPASTPQSAVPIKTEENHASSSGEEDAEPIPPPNHHNNQASLAIFARRQLYKHIIHLQKSIERRLTLLDNHYKNYVKNMEGAFPDNLGSKFASLHELMKGTQMLIKFARAHCT